MISENTVLRLTSAVKFNLCACAAFLPRAAEDSAPLSDYRWGLIRCVCSGCTNQYV